ncbi:MAG TPA: glycosyltransferase, partial [Armatimonadota bacterium]
VENLQITAAALPNVRFLSRQPISEVGSYLAAADTLLIHLKNDPLFRMTIPQKTQAYLAAGRPIIIGVEGNAADLVLRAGAGISCQPENPDSIAAAVRSMAGKSVADRDAMGKNGNAFYQRELSLQVGIRQFDQVFRSVVS